MVVTNVILKLAHFDEKPYTGTDSCWLETLHWDLLMLVRNLTLGSTHAGDKPYNEKGDDKLYTQTCSWLGQTPLRLFYGGDKPYTENFACWWQALLCDSCWWQTLHWDKLMLVTNLTSKHSPAGDKPSMTSVCKMNNSNSSLLCFIRAIWLAAERVLHFDKCHEQDSRNYFPSTGS